MLTKWNYVFYFAPYLYVWHLGMHMFIQMPFPFLAYKHNVIFLFSVPECYILTCTNNHQNPVSIVNYTAAQQITQ